MSDPQQAPSNRHAGLRRCARAAAPLLIAAALVLPGSPDPASAMANGTLVTPTPLNLATVAVGGGCTGTLVAADLVLSAGHCGFGRSLTPPAGVTPFRSRFDWERPDRFYPLPAPVPVTVGNGITLPAFGTVAVEYAAPGITDMILLRLRDAVPASAATPIRMMTSLAHVSDPSAWLRGRTMTIAGFGDTNDADGPTFGVLNQGLADRAEFPCPAGSDWGFPASYFTCVNSADGSGNRGGDSGGPLYWDDSVGRRHLLGVLQGRERRNGGRYVATHYRGGSGYDRNPYPNLGDWLERMVYGREGGPAFLWADAPTAADSYVPKTYSASPTGRLTHVQRLEVGAYVVRFEGLRHPLEGPPRVAFVTSYGSGSEYCKLADARQADKIEVLCYDSSGVRADSRFSLFSDDDFQDMLIQVPRLSSTLGTVTVRSATIRRAAVGQYHLTAPIRPGSTWKNVIASAVGRNSGRCNVRSWTPGSATIACFNHAGTAIDSGFTFGATGKADSSYAFANQPTIPAYTPPTSRSDVAGSMSPPTVRRHRRGEYAVAFNGAPGNVGGNVQITTNGSTANHCKVRSWAAASAEVRCFDPTGSPADTTFTVRYVDPLDVGRQVVIRLNAIHATSRDSCGGMDIYGNLHFTSGATHSLSIPRVDDADERRFAPPIGITARAAPGRRYVDARLELRDDDDFFCGGGDDVIDIASHSAVQDLRMRVDLQANTVEILDSAHTTIGGLGNWSADGRDGSETAQVDFTVEVFDVPPA